MTASGPASRRSSAGGEPPERIAGPAGRPGGRSCAAWPARAACRRRRRGRGGRVRATGRPGPTRPPPADEAAVRRAAARGAVPRPVPGGHPAGAAAGDRGRVVQRDRAEPGRADRAVPDGDRPRPVPDRGRHPAAGRHRRAAVRLGRARADGDAGRAHGDVRRRLDAVRRPVRAAPAARPGWRRCRRSPTTTWTRPSAAAT